MQGSRRSDVESFNVDAATGEMAKRRAESTTKKFVCGALGDREAH
jgi:hypothetical protein